MGLPLEFFAAAVSVAAVSAVVGYCRAAEVAPLPGVPSPDFHVPQGPGRLGVLEPPKRFLHWTDHLEIVLPSADVARRCQTAGAAARPGTRILGCSYIVAGRCLIIRVDDPGVARHELAHCNGWKHPDVQQARPAQDERRGTAPTQIHSRPNRARAVEDCVLSSTNRRYREMFRKGNAKG